MNKVYNLGKIAYIGKNKSNEVEIEYSIKDGRFSMSAQIWNSKHTDIVAGRQMLDEIKKLFPDNAKVQEMHKIWKKWHLNDMHPACVHQRELGWEDKIAKKEVTLNNGNKKTLGWLNDNEHPEEILSKPCPVCGYKYCSAWLTIESW